MGTSQEGIDHGIALLSDQLHPLDDPGNAGIFGDPPIPPRIGNQYQVNLSFLECKPKKQSTAVDAMAGLLDRSLRIYPDVPIYWLDTKPNKSCSETGIDMPLCADIDRDTTVIAQLSKGYKDDSSCEPLHQAWTTAGDEECKQLAAPQNQETEGRVPLPGSPATSLEDADLEGFLLALYIFGKNLHQVEKFLETRKMSDILSFYYGKFYRSTEYRRWSECKKSKSRRCILGHRIFTGWRQHELLNRLLPFTKEEDKPSLLEVTKAFTEGVTSLEDYVLKVKGIVGLKALVEAVGIGKGKLDLTGIALERTRANAILSSRSEVVGKDFSSLATSDIINLLAGNFRLSKQRSNDLFWEAVWPRLLAKGWHSEQPKHKRCVAFKHTLVFLVPGIKKFSRRKLTRGDHYFDSVSDVLHKVASDPRLLELEIDGCKDSNLLGNEDYHLPETRLDDNIKLKHENFCSSDLMKFTVVDTSMVEGPSKIRQLRCLPVDNTLSHTPSTHSDETTSSSSEEPESVDIFIKDDEDDVEKSQSEVVGDSLYYNHEKTILSGHSDYLLPVSESIHIKREAQEVHQYSNLLDQKPMKEMNYQLGKTAKRDKPVYMSPLPKRRRLNACKYAATSNGTWGLFTDKPVKEASSKSLPMNDTGDNKPKQSPPFGAMTTRYDCENISGASVPHSFCSNLICNSPAEEIVLEEKPRTRALIDLNIPQFSPDFDTGCEDNEDIDNNNASTKKEGNCVPDSIHQCVDADDICCEASWSRNCSSERVQQYAIPDDICVDDSENRNHATVLGQNEDPDGLQEVNEVGSEHFNDTNLRRTSTRYRPPTTKVLESLESGFFSLKKERRSRSSRSTKPRTFRARKRCAPPYVSHAYLKPDNCTLEIRDTML